MEEKTEEQKESDRKLDEAGIDPDDPILDDEDKEELAELLSPKFSQLRLTLRKHQTRLW